MYLPHLESRIVLFVTGLVLCATPNTWAQPEARSQSTDRARATARAMAEAANTFLVSLDEQQRSDAQFTFTDEERHNWNFVPMDRAGLPFKRMKPHQRQLAIGLLNSALSHRGFSKAVNIMALEQILHEMEDNSPRRDPSLYHVYIFGSPSAKTTWGWRVEGHHLSVNITLVEGQLITSTPAFFGANPATVDHGAHHGLHVLNREETLARRLVKSLTAEQRETAVVSKEAPDDVINGPGREASALEPAGLSADQLDPKQRRLLINLVREYVFNFRTDLAREDLKKIREGGIDNIHFAWAGGFESGQPHYYRVQGPSFIMEYDNTQNDANHVHTVWRDFKNDFGSDLLRDHYSSVPHEE